MKDRAWREIVRRDMMWEERVSVSGRSYSWRSIRVHQLWLDCGHVQHRRGDNVPKTRVICKACEAGKPALRVPIVPGVFDCTREEEPKGAAVVRALAANERAKLEKPPEPPKPKPRITKMTLTYGKRR